jgi:hypothetical protein
MKKIPLTQGQFATVDDEDFDMVSSCRWHYTHGYAKSYKGGYMHRMILSAKDGEIIDHINGDKLDNRRSNIRLANKSLNGINRGLNKNNTHGFKGINFFKGRRKPWAARIKVNRKYICLGYYFTKEEAGAAYVAASKKYFGEFAP